MWNCDGGKSDKERNDDNSFEAIRLIWRPNLQAILRVKEGIEADLTVLAPTRHVAVRKGYGSHLKKRTVSGLFTNIGKPLDFDRASQPDTAGQGGTYRSPMTSERPFTFAATRIPHLHHAVIGASYNSKGVSDERPDAFDVAEECLQAPPSCRVK